MAATDPTTQILINQAIQQAKTQAAYLQQNSAYTQSIARLKPAWSVLPTAPYPPAGDTTGFPETGTTTLLIDPKGISALQAAEPQAVAKNLYDQSVARRPKPNVLFLIGLGLVGYWAYKLR